MVATTFILEIKFSAPIRFHIFQLYNFSVKKPVHESNFVPSQVEWNDAKNAFCVSSVEVFCGVATKIRSNRHVMRTAKPNTLLIRYSEHHFSPVSDISSEFVEGELASAYILCRTPLRLRHVPRLPKILIA